MINDAEKADFRPLILGLGIAFGVLLALLSSCGSTPRDAGVDSHVPTSTTSTTT